jgi:hypothetical protein
MATRWKFGRSVLAPLVLAVAGFYMFIANFDWFLFQIADVEFLDARAQVVAKKEVTSAGRHGRGVSYYVDFEALEANPRTGRAKVNAQFYSGLGVGDQILVLTRGKKLFLADDVRWERNPYFWIFCGAGLFGLAGAIQALVGIRRWRRG